MATDTSAPLEIRYEFAVRWPAWQYRGWIEVRDCFTGEWLMLPSAEVPPRWRRAATIDKKRREGTL